MNTTITSRHWRNWRGIGLLAASCAVGAMPLRAQDEAAARVDLRPLFARWNLSIEHQRQRDTCAVFTVTGALEFALAKDLGQGIGLGEEYLNWAANQIAGQDRDGASFAELARAFAKWGVCDETLMPYTAAFMPALQPSAEATQSAHAVWKRGLKWHWIAAQRTAGLSDAHLERAKAVLRRGYPVAAEGEHCLLLVGFDDAGGIFRVRNHATRRNETLTYQQAKARFMSLLWIEAPAKKG